MMKHVDRVVVGIIGGAVLLIAGVVFLGITAFGGDGSSTTSSGPDNGRTPTTPIESPPSTEASTSSAGATTTSLALPTTTGPLPELPQLVDEVREPTVSAMKAGLPNAEQVDAQALSVATSDDPCDRLDTPPATEVVDETGPLADGVLAELWQAQSADLALLQSQCENDGETDPELVETIVTRAQLIQLRKDQL